MEKYYQWSLPLVLICLICFCTARPAAGADLAAGRNRAAICTGCHGYAGISANNEWPNLAGQKTGYLVQQLKAFRDGTRVDPVMSPMVQGLTEQDMELVATWFNSLGH